MRDIGLEGIDFLYDKSCEYVGKKKKVGGGGTPNSNVSNLSKLKNYRVLYIAIICRDYRAAKQA
jgi:hypothetical protein